MAKLGSIEFDDQILDALRDDRLVVFAGAGVSMGSPSNLPSFEKLVRDIASGTGRDPTVPLDRFLGQLQHNKTAVHERAAQFLSLPASEPNALHFDLLRLFRSRRQVRLVTTNFDFHFESAATKLFGESPEVFRAPALPRGRDFAGIVHVHGSLARADEMVLTDSDFGRAYLTEGWARRFLVDVFRRFTVLFVGYSHSDVVMTYLARALPAETLAGRFALTEEDGNWDLLGITPTRFSKGTGSATYAELYDGIKRLAERTARDALAWQARIAELASRNPPADEESIGEIEQALRQVHTTRFLVNVARHPEWPTWLNARKQLDALFRSPQLSERDHLLASWLAMNYASEQPTALFGLIAAHGMELNSQFWWSLAREIGVNDKSELKAANLKRWVTILLQTTPSRTDHHPLMWLAERCASLGLPDLALQIFLAMGEHRLHLRDAVAWDESDGSDERPRLQATCPIRSEQWPLNEVWTKCLKPELPTIAHALVGGVTARLESTYRGLSAWDRASVEWDPVSYGRSAIEPHEQDRYPEAIDVLVDAARDSLESLAHSDPTVLNSWIALLAVSEAALLRRLAIHAVGVCPDMDASSRLRWVVEKIGLHRLADHHEVYRLASMNYADADDATRQIVVDAVSAHQLPASEKRSAEMRTARSHFNWLSWLLRAKQDCAIATAALAPIRAAYPDWELSEHPDLTHWVGSADWVGSQSPWSMDQLLSRTPEEQFDDLLSFKGASRFDGPDREGLLSTIREACTKKPVWGFDLAAHLQERALWSSDLWPPLLRGLQDADLAVSGWHTILGLAAQPNLQKSHEHEIASLLYAIVKDGGKPFALDLLEEANAIATTLWPSLKTHPDDLKTDDWLSRAINRPAGVVVEFWINGLSLLSLGKSKPERTLPDSYRQWFEKVLDDSSSNGGLGRSVLAGQTAFLFGLDATWTLQHVIPLFTHADSQKFAQAWDGFLVWGRLYSSLVDALFNAFLAAVPRFAGRSADDRRRFIEFYAALVAFHVTDPTKDLLPVLLRHGSLDDRVTFAAQLRYFLEQMGVEAADKVCDLWALRYWQDRLQAVPIPLDESERRSMLEWLPHLDKAFPKAVAIATTAPAIRLEHSLLLHLLKESTLRSRYPSEMAALLIYLCGGDLGYHSHEVGAIASQLPPIPPDLKKELDECLARVGAK